MVMAKKKLREWEIPMNLSNQERVLYKMTVVDQINNSSKIATENFQLIKLTLKNKSNEKDLNSLSPVRLDLRTSWKF